MTGERRRRRSERSSTGAQNGNAMRRCKNNDGDDNNSNDESNNDKRNHGWLISWIAEAAILGDSSRSLGISLLLLVGSVFVSLYFHTATTTTTTTVASPPIIPASSTASSLSLGLFATYESLGPLPTAATSEKGPVIYHIISMPPNNQTTTSQDDASSVHGAADAVVVTEVNGLTNGMRAEFERDGVLCVRGLISPDLLERLDRETAIGGASNTTHNNDDDDTATRQNSKQRKRATQFHTVTHSVIFKTNPKDKDDVETDTTTTTTTPVPSALLEVSLWSAVPAFVASLINVSTATSFSTKDDAIAREFNSNTNNQHQQQQNNASWTVEPVRLIRDIFLAKDDDPYVCGWHVDDMGFWPATPESPNGINAWIALDDMVDAAHTGGFALAVQSHTAPWRAAAYAATGASAHFPTGGYHNASHLFAHRTGQGTCNMAKVAPHIHRRMEETKRVYPVKRGDVIFHTRWLFHRTIAMNEETKEEISTVPISSSKISSSSTSIDSGNEMRRVYRRYSIRYGPGASTFIPPGYGTELSVLWNSSNGGRTANDVCAYDGPWYPQAWPPMTGETRDQFWTELQHLVTEKLPIAEQRRAQRIQEMKPLLNRMAKEQHRQAMQAQR